MRDELALTSTNAPTHARTRSPSNRERTKTWHGTALKVFAAARNRKPVRGAVRCVERGGGCCRRAIHIHGTWAHIRKHRHVCLCSYAMRCRVDDDDDDATFPYQCARMRDARHKSHPNVFVGGGFCVSFAPHRDSSTPYTGCGGGVTLESVECSSTHAHSHTRQDISVRSNTIPVACARVCVCVNMSKQPRSIYIRCRNRSVCMNCTTHMQSKLSGRRAHLPSPQNRAHFHHHPAANEKDGIGKQTHRKINMFSRGCFVRI